MTRIFVGPRLFALLLSVVIAGVSLGLASTAFGLFIWTGTGPLYENSGGEKVAALEVQGSTTGWSGCDGSNCSASGGNIRIQWSITDGSSTFEGIWGLQDGNGGEACAGGLDYTYVGAGPSYSSGYGYVYPHSGICTAGYGTYWGWAGGMCDAYGWCQNESLANVGPNISWYWIAPNTSAQFTQYRW
jgi:hypothetical protein